MTCENSKKDESDDPNISKSSDGGDNEIEYILNDIGGSYSRFQILNYTLFSIPICMVGMIGLSYVFTSLNLEYR